MPMKVSANKSADAQKLSVIRSYTIGGTRYIVTASTKAGAREDASAKVRRLLQRDIKEVSEKFTK